MNYFEICGPRLTVTSSSKLFILGTVSGEEASGQVAILCRSNLGVIKQVMATLRAEPDKKVAVVGGAEKLGLDLLLDLYALSKPILERKGVSWWINLHYTRGITPKRVTSAGIHLCGVAPG